MNLRRDLSIVVLAATIASVHAQAFTGPFPPMATENFDTMIPNSYVGFPGFAGTAGLSRIGTGGLLMVNNSAAILPPLTGANDMFGRGVNVRIRFQSVRKRFGGFFRVPNAGIAVTMMGVRFFKAGVPVGVPVMATINNTTWQWRGWDVGYLGGYDEVRIYGNGSLPGYVGMDRMATG